MDWHARIATLAAWQATDDAARDEALTAIAAAMGDGWAAGRRRVGRAGLGEVRHDRHGGFVVVPGGWLRMGLSVDDLLAGARARDDGAPGLTWGGAPLASRPTRWVRMRPYLLAIAGVPPEGEDAGSDGGAKSAAYRDAVEAQRRREAGDDDAPHDDADAPHDDADAPHDDADAPHDDADATHDDADDEPAMRIVAPEDAASLIPDGFRLPSEAELEWALREGGTTRWIGVAGDVVVTATNRRAVLLGELCNGFGLRGLRDLQNLCADGAVNYDDDSPIDQAAVATDRPDRIARWAHTYWQDDDAELLGCHAAHRARPDEYGESIVRLAADLPEVGAPDGEPPGALAEDAATLAALAGDDPRGQADARTALAYLAQGSGADAGPTVAAVLAALPTLAAPLRAPILTWLADVQVGGHFHRTVERPERSRRATLAGDRAAVRAAVAAGAMTIAACLDDADPDVRSAAALALTFAVDAPAEAKAALAARLGREAEVGVQAALVLALIRLGSGFRAPAPDPAIRAALAIATAFDGPPDLAALTVAAALPPVPHLAYAGGRLGDVAIGILRKQPAEVQAEAAVDLAERAVAEADPQLATVIFEMGFGADPTTPVPPRLPEELPSHQRQLMAKLVGFDQLPWAAHGLSPTALGRRRALGLEPPGASDRFVTHGDGEAPLWVAVWATQLGEGDDAAAALVERLAATWPAGERLALYLDRGTHGLWAALDGWDLEALIAALPSDPAARATVDELAAVGPRSPEVLRAVIATRPGETLPGAWLDDLDEWSFGVDAGVLAGFAPAEVERRLLALLAPALARALASDRWAIGLDQQLTRWAGALAVTPSARATRQLLLLGWAAGQPAAVRAAVGAAGGSHAAVAEVLAQYDTLPEFTSWPRARAVLPTYAE